MDEDEDQRRRRGSFGVGVAAAEAAAGEQTAVRRAVLTPAVRVGAAAHFERAVARELRLEALDERRDACSRLRVRCRALGGLTLECGSRWLRLSLRLPHEHTQCTCAQHHMTVIDSSQAYVHKADDMHRRASIRSIPTAGVPSRLIRVRTLLRRSHLLVLIDSTIPA